MILAEMDLADLARLKLRDVEHRRLVALLALHLALHLGHVQ
jgi:hypothetical protein